MEKIGEGGFAKVRIAKHKLSGEKVRAMRRGSPLLLLVSCRSTSPLSSPLARIALLCCAQQAIRTEEWGKGNPFARSSSCFCLDVCWSLTSAL